MHDHPHEHEPSALETALANTLQQLAARPVCIQNLLGVERFARAARAMLHATMRHTVDSARESLGFDDDIGGYGIGGIGSAVLAPSSETENFGSKALRNIAGAGGFQKMMEDVIRAQNWTPEKILQAMATAKELGLTEEYDELRKQLLPRAELVASVEPTDGDDVVMLGEED